MMFTKVIKWGAIGALLGNALFRSTPEYAIPFQLVVSVFAAIVLTQAATMRRYVWMTLFVVVACLFNPVFPVPFSRFMFGMVTSLSALLFFLSVELLQPKPPLSVASVTRRMPGRGLL